MNVVFARKAAGIAYPQSGHSSLGRGICLLRNLRLRSPPVYAEKAEAEKSEAAHRFNCAQRESSVTWANFQRLRHQVRRTREHVGKHSAYSHIVSFVRVPSCVPTEIFCFLEG